MAGVIEDDSQIEDLHVHRERGDRTATLITLKEYEVCECEKNSENK